MKQNDNRTLTPKLRFPEFRDEPGWEEAPLEQIADRVTTKNLDGSITRVLTNSAEHGIVDQRDYFDKDIANAGNIDGYCIVDLGDYVYNPRISTLAPVGPISKNNIGKGVMSPLYTVFRFEAENTDFYHHYFKTTSWHSYLRRVSSMGARHDRMSIKTGDFMAMPVPTPLTREQQKIADCLGSLDELIAAEGQKLVALRDHKRGLMQQIFPHAGETQPRLRFPEFRGKEDWVEKPLGEIAEIKLGKMLDKNKNRSGRLLPYLNNLAVRWNSFDTSDLPKMYFNENELEKYGLRKGDVIVCEGGEPGRAAVWDERLPGLKFQKALHRVRFKIQFVPHLLVHYLETIAGTPILESLFTGGGIKHLTRERLAELKIPIATSTEQQAIADCLSSLDNQIAALAKKIDTLKKHKRGLMQQLFPATDELEV